MRRSVTGQEEAAAHTAAAADAGHWAYSDFDVRVGTPHADPFTHGVNLRDILGGSLVTYDEHIDASSEACAKPLGPKAVFVQYQMADPVTGEAAPVVVPAQLSLDVFADPHFLGTSLEEEDSSEEEVDDGTTDDRRKLRSNIRGDPILMRAKPAPPPDAYFAPKRYETLHTAGDAWAHTVHGALRSKKQSTANGTMSSFKKASGRDKYSLSRLSEIDEILKSMQARFSTQQSSADGEDDFEARGFRIRRGLGESGGVANASDIAFHIQRIPQFHNGHNAQSPAATKTAGSASPDSAGDPIGDSSSHKSPSPDNAQTRGNVAFQSPHGPGSPPGSARPRARRPCGLRAGGQVVLRELDPHIENLDTVPTLRMHGNWPDGPRKQLARYFYGMSSARIIEEEEKEQIRERQHSKRATHDAITETEAGSTEEAASGAIAAASAKSKLQRTRRLEQDLMRGATGGTVPHRLEVRISNNEKSGRVVVAQHTVR
eukprot:gnl/TRDRNA2_/TRDRNA2_184787_c0_seq1.p1 gnl/TRDRNA2_/TRDRNA2_184787_c0~~gnl/TRDRNA2_/TRDRNA2_184787_c0_seq1.p1  ORF type:complete len:487 (+),score=84.73 gnl/TRDRNA2_/TRDRNA2_184787_c0_seq1:115-1575(+)